MWGYMTIQILEIEILRDYISESKTYLKKIKICVLGLINIYDQVFPSLKSFKYF